MVMERFLEKKLGTTPLNPSPAKAMEKTLFVMGLVPIQQE